MRRPAIQRRAALNAAEVATWSGARTAGASAEELRFRRSPGVLPPGQRIYVVGDVHGCLTELRRLHEIIRQDLEQRPARATLIHLGDYIDHGPDSACVLDHLLAGTPNLPTVNLLGDHERMLLEALDGDRAAATDWLHGGGRASLESWGLGPDLARGEWPRAIPERHVAFMRSLQHQHEQGGYLFVHAGIRPGVPPGRQSLDDLLTIRQPFLWTEQDFGRIVVHGHSAGPEVVIAVNRIGLDTGAGTGGPLTCAVLEDDLIGLISV